MRKGSKMTKESCKRISEACKGRAAWNKGGSNTWAIAEKNVNWSGGKLRTEVAKAYRERNRDKVREWKKAYHARKKKDPKYLLATNLRKRMLKVLGRKGDRESAIDFLGCSVRELRFFLEGKFKEGMSWENHGNKGWHIDHIIP